MFVAPTVKLAVGADRDILTGNYEWRANLSMPVDTFMRGTCSGSPGLAADGKVIPGRRPPDWGLKSPP